MSEPTADVDLSRAAETDFPPMAYVSMSPKPDVEAIYLRVIKPTLERHGLTCKHNESKSGSGIIIGQTFEHIDEADLVLCDLTYGHPPTYYDLGIAHAFRKPTILISQETGDIPFDTRYLRALAYKGDRFSLLELRDTLSALLEDWYPRGAAASAPRQPALDRVIPATLTELEAARNALFHYSTDAKRYALRILGDNADRSSYDKILWLVNKEDEAPELVRDALTALAKIDPERALQEALLGRQGIWHPNHLVRERVVNLIGAYAKTDLLINRLMDQLSDTSWGVRMAVCLQLGKWKAAEARNVLRQRRVDPEQAVRVAADEALYNIARAEQAGQEGGDHAPSSKLERT